MILLYIFLSPIVLIAGCIFTGFLIAIISSLVDAISSMMDR